MRRRDWLAMVAFGLALSIKFQAIFMGPFLLVLLLLKGFRFRTLFIPPLIYFITLLPSWALGRPIEELLLIYPNQVGSFPNLTLNAPTFYALIDNSVNYLFNPVGILLAAVIVMLIVYAVYKLRPRLHLDLMVGMAAACLLLLPYILPKMHERYFYPAEVFFLLFAFYRPRLAFVPVVLQITALVTYSYYFFGYSFLSLTTDSLIMLGLLIYLLYDQAHRIMESREPASTPTTGAA